MVRVRDEDRDWAIYHTLLDGKARTVADLAATGHDPARVEESINRLERYHLVRRIGDAVEPLSFMEAILLCRLANDPESPLYCEDGVIRVRTKKNREE